MTKITVGLFGFGRTGQSVAGELLNDERFDLRWIVRKHFNPQIQYATQAFHLEPLRAPIYIKRELPANFFAAHPVDIIIDFSSTEAYKTYRKAADLGIRIISAISAYDQSAIDSLRQYARKTSVLYSPNITVGINFLMIASLLLRRIIPHADIEIVEEHFREKPETSGTALKIARALELDTEKHINSVRVGGIVGKHQIIFGLKNQTIRLVHESINKAAFGQGAIFAALWLMKQPAGYYTMDEIITSAMQEHLEEAARTGWDAKPVEPVAAAVE